MAQHHTKIGLNTAGYKHGLVTAMLFMTFLFHLSISFATTDSTEEGGLLYRITSTSGRVNHLFGTMHLPDSSVFVARDTVLAVLDASLYFTAELDLDSAPAGFDPESMFLNNETLYDLLDSTKVRRICERLRLLVPEMSMICHRLKPGLIAILLAMDKKSRTAPVAMDQFLWNRAKRRGLKLSGLETMLEQMALIDSIKASDLVRQLDDLENNPNATDSLIAAYCAEDLETLASISSEQDVNDVLKTLNDERNVRMVERMLPALLRGGVFVAVGALHLTGPMSIPLLLSNAGFLVEPVLGGNRSQWLDTTY